jgi:hypothetical protein
MILICHLRANTIIGNKNRILVLKICTSKVFLAVGSNGKTIHVTKEEKKLDHPVVHI